MMTQFSWTRFYEAAILETDRSKLAVHIPAAEAAIKVRAQELTKNQEGTEEERIALNDAISGLKILRQELRAISDASSAPSQRFTGNCTGSPNA